MNKLKEINGKYYQECEVVMLSTALLGIDDNSGKLFKFEPKEALWGYQHLYFLSNEKIEDDDWCIFMYDLVPKYGVCKGRNIQDKSLAKKIVATTDTSLEYITENVDGLGNDLHQPLPQPSKEFIQAFIAAYNESKPITKVLVEYWAHTEEDLQLKVNFSNEITIKKIKDSYTREEVVELFNKWRKDFPLHRGIQITDFDLNNWIAENL